MSDEIDIRKFNIQAGDVLLVRVAYPVSTETKRRIQSLIARDLGEPATPPILVLGPGESIEILRPSGEAFSAAVIDVVKKANANSPGWLR